MTSLKPKPRILGIDYGTRKTGIAISGPLGTLCSPLSTVDTKKIYSEIESRIEEYDVSKIVVGWPINEDGSHQEITRTVEDFIGRLRKKVDIEIVAWDERYSSMRARAMLKDSGASKKRRNQRGAVDAIAAVVILEEYLEANPFSQSPSEE